MSKENKPKVLAVFRADCRATKGRGSTVAVVQGSSGKCRLYGRNSLAKAFPDQAALMPSLSSAQSMAAFFHCPLADGKAACDALVAKLSIEWSGPEAVLADYGKRERKAGSPAAYSFSAF